MWQFEHSETTTASPEQLWAHYSDPVTWPRWDHGTAEVTIDGPMAAGTTGKLKPVKGPRARFVFTDVTPGVGFTDVTRLPLARLTFAHVIEPVSGSSRITHRVSLSGPLSPLFARVVGRTIAAELPSAMRALVRLAEETPSPAVPR